MKLTIDQATIVEVFNQLSRFKGKEVLQNISLNVSKEEAIFRATDGEVSYTRKLSLIDNKLITVEKIGSVLLPPKVEEVIRKLSKSSISIQVLENGQIELKQGKTSAKVNAAQGEFPNLPNVEKQEAIKLSTKVLSMLCSQTAFAASEKDGRPVLKAIHMESDDQQFKVICTDSYRLSQKVLNKSLSLPVLNIPAKPLMYVIQTLDEDASLQLFAAGNHIVITTEESEIYIRQLEGTFPDVSRLLSAKPLSKVTVQKGEILSAIECALTFTKNEKDRQITIEPVEDNNLKIYSTGEEGSLESFVQGDFENVEKIQKFTVNAGYLTAAIKAFIKPEITFQYESSTKPILLVSKSDPTLTQMVVPIRTN
ncbi:DNA polymerase III subunit beta [Rummeliibacillus stabekisii]|uniref:DNA polymerase III subunit beta n=1 Tax=Rummeliibacillus stabekisii TaxID=241244 RepID=UPI00371E6181